MDLGVGAFVFSGGIVAGPRLKSGQERPWAKFVKSVKVSLPILLLGVVRIVLTKSVNYQEHVTEYGVHWNFFVTLGLIPIFVTLLELAFANLAISSLGFRVAFAYNAALRLLNLEDYILHAPRKNFFSMNREGICSFLGYLSIFLIAAGLGNRLSKWQDVHSHYEKTRRDLVISASVLSFTCACSMYALGFDVSRRMANGSYVTWVCAACILHVLGCLAIEDLFSRRGLLRKRPLLFESINRNQLGYFLLGNVLTGLVNMSMNTLSVSDAVGFTVVAVYLFVVGAAVVFLYKMNWKLKL
ncbi:Glucosaminyl phosphatidylinositol (GlcN-PI) nositol acylation protein [Borealophlyctis nickersoniae]|nr:Glucosaminyl phosphatidylinositol (GlcN-PI) nositol acylation protein [Borealophlyctis nickersoniae]